MRFYFVRHGESEANVLGLITNRGSAYPLTVKGRGQVGGAGTEARRCGDHPDGFEPVVARRADRRHPVGAARTWVHVTDALREFDCGVLEGKSDPDSWAIHNEVWRDWSERGQWESRIEGGESFLDMRDRFVPFLEGVIAAGRDGESTLLVGHGGLYVNMLPLVLANVEPARAAGLPFPNTGYVVAESSPEGLVCLEWCGISDGRMR